MSLTPRGPAYIAKHLYRYDRIHQAIASPAALTKAHHVEYHERGFIAVENVFSPAEVEAAKDGLSFLVGGGKPDFKGVLQFEEGVNVEGLTAEAREKHVRKLMYFAAEDARLGALAASPKLLGIVEWLLGEKVKLTQDMALLKPPHIGREKPWHQDNAYFMIEPLELVIGTWTALDEATLQNGCMHVIPGSHKKGARPHYHDRDCQLADEDVAVDEDVTVPLKPGGVLFFYGLLHHGTPPNQSATRRRAIQYHYAAERCRKTTPQEHGKFFYDPKGMAACTGMKVRSIADKF